MKKLFLSSRKHDLGCSSLILDLGSSFFPSQIPHPDPGVKKAPDAGSVSATLLPTQKIRIHNKCWRALGQRYSPTLFTSRKNDWLLVILRIFLARAQAGWLMYTNSSGICFPKWTNTYRKIGLIKCSLIIKISVVEPKVQYFFRLRLQLRLRIVL